MKQGRLDTGQGRQQGPEETTKVKVTKAAHHPRRQQKQCESETWCACQWKTEGNARLLVWVPYNLSSNFSDSIQTFFKQQIKQKSSESIKRKVSTLLGLPQGTLYGKGLSSKTHL